MNVRIWALAAGLLILALGGCTHWEKPGATAQEFEATKAACNARSFARYPPAPQQVAISSGYQTNATTDCHVMGSFISCTTTPGRYIPPTTMTVDYSATSRSMDFSNCLIENGWTEVYDGASTKGSNSNYGVQQGSKSKYEQCMDSCAAEGQEHVVCWRRCQ